MKEVLGAKNFNFLRRVVWITSFSAYLAIGLNNLNSVKPFMFPGEFNSTFIDEIILFFFIYM